jgi:hypothetical protein
MQEMAEEKYKINGEIQARDLNAPSADSAG